MKEQEFKTVLALGAVDYVCCFNVGDAWELWVYGDDQDPAKKREVDRLGNCLRTARNENREWKSLDSLVDFLVRSGVKYSAIQLDGPLSATNGSGPGLGI